MKKLLLKLFIFLTPIVLVLIITNIYSDPAHLFRQKSYEQGMSDILLKGKNIANFSNYDERIVQKLFLNGLDEKKDIIVLGSSRSMEIRSIYFPDQSIFNACVSGATIEDYLALTQILFENKLLPKTVIIGIDPWIFNKNNNLIRWKSLEKEYSNFLGKDNLLLGSLNFQIYKNLFSFSYFQESLKQITRPQVGISSEYYATESEDLDVNVERADGSIAYNKQYREIDLEKILSETKYFINSESYGLEQFSEIDQYNLDIFYKLLDFYKRNSVEVIFFLSPYNPIVYDYINSSAKLSIIHDIESLIQKVSNLHEIRVIGSYNPNDYNLELIDFYDSMHPRSHVIKQILERY